MDIFWHEINSYKAEIKSLQKEIDDSLQNIGSIDNLTHFSLRISNRASLILVGLCSLVEIFLYDLVTNEERNNPLKLKDIKEGNGLTKLKSYLSRTRRVDFGKVSHWGTFLQIYTLRNAFVHSYGGLVETRLLEKTEQATQYLKIESALVGGRRLRLSPNHLMVFCQTIESLIEELKKSSEI